LSPSLVFKVAKAGASVLSKHTDHAPTVFIGRDTRISGTLIESAMVAGFLSYGANVKTLGVIPTPAVAYLTKKYGVDASVVISASHNTFEYNGVKYFSNKGMKIPDSLEEEIEEIMDSGKLDELTAINDKIGVSENREDMLEEYVFFFRKIFEDKLIDVLDDNFKVLIPITLPSLLTNAPPLLPELIAASVCIHLYDLPSESVIFLLTALIIPVVTVLFIFTGFPTAIANSPTLTSSESANSAFVKPVFSILITAKSVCSSWPTIFASYSVSSLYK